MDNFLDPQNLVCANPSTDTSETQEQPTGARSQAWFAVPELCCWPRLVMGGLGEVAAVLPEQHAANFEFIKILEFSVLPWAECRMRRFVGLVAR